MDESLQACGTGHSCMAEGSAEENQSGLLRDVKDQGPARK